MFNIYIEDALDHGTMIESFDTYEEAKVAYDEMVKEGADEYELSIELAEVSEDFDEFITKDYHEWFTYEEWCDNRQGA